MSESAQRADALAALVRIGNIFHTERSLDRLLSVIVQETYLLLGAEAGSIFLLDAETGEVWSKVATGLKEGEVIRMPKSIGIVGRVIETGESINVPDAYSDPRFNPDVDKATGYRTRTILCVPLTTLHGETIGAFQVLNKRQPFAVADEEILRLIASQACTAIENVQLYDDLQSAHDQLHAENVTLKQQLKKGYGHPAIVGDSSAMQRVKEVVRKVASSNASVLITGEPGTGKELVARSIHNQSPRAGEPFVPLNCAALPESLLEAELFGIEKGVATGVSQRPGLLVQASGGTIFLDEIGDMPQSTQAKLLRALQERAVRPLGGTKEVAVDIRVLSATNHNLMREIQAKRFREDLFYRLNVFPIHLPPLRERTGDVPLLAKFILNNVLKVMGVPAKTFSDGSLEAMERHPWPGNIREMENLIERAVILSDGPRIELTGLLQEAAAAGAPEPAADPAVPPSAGLGAELGAGTGAGAPFGADPADEELRLPARVQTLETSLILKALERTRGNQLQAAKLLGISREGLRKKIGRYQVDWRAGRA